MRKLVLLLSSILMLSVFGLPSSYAQESKVSLLSSAAYTDQYGIYHLVGEVKNNSGGTISFVKIIATFYDSSGKVVASEFTYTEIETLRNGEKSPFEISTMDQSQISKFANYKLSVSWSAGAAKPASLVLKTGDSYLDSYGIYHFVGEVTNNGDKTATFVKVASAFYDANVHVVMAGFTYTASDISAGQSSPFEITLMGDDVGKIKSASVNVQSQQYSMVDTSLPSAAPSPEPAPTTSTNTAPSNPTPSASQSTFDVSLSTISVVDFSGTPINNSDIHTGTQMLLTSSVQNNRAQSLPFMTLFEVRDSSGATISLQLMSGKLASNDSMTVGVSWVPEGKGDYEIRTFAISDFKTFKILSPVSTTTISVT